ncbi:hypothetical protein KM043_017101 [Ampulex compressa]|nr:hypothetical protein KM043_017101 [Ampulex compressa]
MSKLAENSTGNLKRQADKGEELTAEELVDASETLKPGKAAGQDQIPAEILKRTTRTHIQESLAVINRILIVENFPQPWKKALLMLTEKPKKKKKQTTKYKERKYKEL